MKVFPTNLILLSKKKKKSSAIVLQFSFQFFLNLKANKELLRYLKKKKKNPLDEMLVLFYLAIRFFVATALCTCICILLQTLTK